jgi:ribonuclease G
VAVQERNPGGGGKGGRGGQKKNESAKSGSAKGGGADGGWKVAELYVERRGQRSIVGNIYKGVIDNVLPGMEAAFVDIGLERNGFLHVDEIVLPGGQQAPRRGRGKGRRIDELIKPRQEILVQVVKDPLKTKGARLTMQLSVAGRYLVYMPQGSGVGVSRRLPDKERDRLRKLLDKAYDGTGGLIIRTAAQGAKKDDLEREIDYLHKLNEVLERRAADVEAPALVFQEADLSVRVLRDVLQSEFEAAIIDDEKQHQRVTSFFQRTAPELVGSVELDRNKRPLFERYGIDEAFASTLQRRVDLPSGGYLMIDYAEALTVIDVNTGSFTGRGRGRLEDTITKVNVEAADEAVRQLRLRDIGGIIVIDFIDMARARNRDQVLKTLRKALDEDKTKTYVVEVSPLGLVEMTRQNVTEGVREILTKRCPTCDGEGVVKSEETVAIQILRLLRDVIEDQPEPEAHLIRVNPKVAAELLRTDSGLEELEAETGKHFHFEGGDALGIETFDVIESGTRDKIEAQALPFQVGEEVLVTIEEPHMFNADDAIARVDSYIVSVTGGNAHVGQRRMVRIESVERSAAIASLLDGGNGAADGSGEDESGDDGQLESTPPRRRGRRGGRRRSRAKSTESSD